jgi:cell division topological specificity factor
MEPDQGASIVKSKDRAKNRLKLILLTDRLKLSPTQLETIKLELRQVLAKYLPVDMQTIEVLLEDHLSDPQLVIQAPLFKKS